MASVYANDGQDSAGDISMNWLQKIASPEGWLRSQGVPDEVLRYALDDNKFPRKMQKWVALQLGKEIKALTNPVDKAVYQFIIDRNDRQLIEIRDWFNHKSATERGFDVNRFDFKSALQQVDIWQAQMAEERGEGHARYYTQPDYNAEDLGNGFRMVEVVPDDLENEGAIMQHCVGDDSQGYKESVEKGQSKIFSLRDARGWPHATIEVQNENDFDIDEFDNDPETLQYDEMGNQIDVDWNAYNQKHAAWNIAQIQGKQNEPPISKYRPYLKTWLETHKNEFNVSSDDLLSVTPEEELLPMIFADPSNADTFKKLHKYLSPEGKAVIVDKIIEDQGREWNVQAVEEMLTNLTDAYPYGGTESMSSEESKAKRMSILTSFLSMDHADAIRSRAMHSLSIDLIGDAKRDPQTKEWLKGIVSQEDSSPGVADAALKLLADSVEVPSVDAPGNPRRSAYYDQYSDEILPLALATSERFGRRDMFPGSANLHTHILGTALRSNIDNQTAATLVERAMIKSMVSTYEMRSDLNKVDPKKFYEIWQLLSDKTRGKLMKDDRREIGGSATIYEGMNEHQFALEEWAKYQKEWDRYNNNVQHAPQLQPPDVQVPEWQPGWARGTPENEELMERNFQALRGRNASCWLQKIAK